jgi:ribosomal protein S18 acetylase RimI-like enzyme
VQIRPATDQDAAVAAQLWTEAYAGRGPNGEGRREPYAERDFRKAVERGEVLVAERGAEVVGIVVHLPPGATGRAVAGPGESELLRLAVAESARRQGTGRALAEACAALARTVGAEAIALWSRPYQTEAHRLYESLGYARVPGRDGHDEDGSRLVFVLSL